MEHRTLGRTGLQVSALGFGGAPIGISNYLGSEDRNDPAFHDRAVEALELAVHLGVTYFDTAAAYGNGKSETTYGRALEPHRDRIVIATKIIPEAHRIPYEQRTETVRASLERLKTDHVDLLQIHGNWWDEKRTADLLNSDVLDWADEMRKRGHTRFIGITAEGPSGDLERLLQTKRFDVLHVAFNFIYQSVCDYQREPRGVIPLAKSLGMGVTTMRTATSGVLQKLLRTEFPEIDTIRLTRLALNFVLSTPEVDCAIVGMKTPQEVADNVALAEDTGARIDLRKIHDRLDGVAL